MVFLSIEDAAQLSDIQWVDCRHDLTKPDWGYDAYSKEHISGAVFAHLDKDLSGNITDMTGRHPLPELLDFITWLEKNGLSPDKPIVGYDNFNGGIAARLWWMLTQIGYTDVHIMLGSFSEWKEKGFPTSDEIITNQPISLDIKLTNWDQGSYSVKSMKEIEEIVPSNYLIDSRTSDRYNGETEPYDKVAGHIPGAINLPWSSSITEDLNIKSNLKEELSSKLVIDQLDRYTVYCGSGVTACFNLAVFAELNLPKPSLYPGSYSEWSRNHPDNIE